MADQWSFAWGQNKFGPFTSQEMRALAASGRLQPDDTVWKEGVEEGVAAARIKNLFVGRDASLTPAPQPAEHGPTSPAPDENLPGEESLPSDADFIVAEQPTDDPAQENDSDNSSETLAPAKAPPPPAKEKERKGIVMGATAAIVLGQDGRTVQIRKKCRKCGHEDTTRTPLPIRNGPCRCIFFCPHSHKPTTA